MTIAPAAVEPNADRGKPDEPADKLGEHDGHRGDSGRSDEEVLPKRRPFCQFLGAN